jgi:predicted SprT family Zn-dependent metalloprotease
MPFVEHLDLLRSIFNELNEKHFDGFLDMPVLRWNSRLRASAGRFTPGSRNQKALWWKPPIYKEPRLPIIEFARYLLDEPNSQELLRDTMAHELVHYWLWARGRPYGHTEEFMRKLEQLGASRWNPVPRTRPYKYAYRCTHCEKEFFARRKLRPLACLKCCNEHADGKYDSRFSLVFDRELSSAEAAELRK